MRFFYIKVKGNMTNAVTMRFDEVQTFSNFTETIFVVKATGP